MKAIGGARETDERRAGKQAWPRIYSCEQVRIQQFRAYLAHEKLAGHIVGDYAITLNRATGRYEAVVLQVGQPLTLASKIGLWTLAGVSVAGAVGWLVWESRYIIGMTACGVIVLVALAHMGGNHRVGCLGVLMHCAGCKG